ncbi:MAG TPA: dihydroorotate dehydrogenase catalytic subunit, partial [Pseudobacillus sp.]
ADAVAIGTANFSNPFICPELIRELDEYLIENHIDHISELTGRSWGEDGKRAYHCS